MIMDKSWLVLEERLLPFLHCLNKRSPDLVKEIPTSWLMLLVQRSMLNISLPSQSLHLDLLVRMSLSRIPQPTSVLCLTHIHPAMEILWPLKGPFYTPTSLVHRYHWHRAGWMHSLSLSLSNGLPCNLLAWWTMFSPCWCQLEMITPHSFQTLLHLCNTDNHYLHTHGHENRES